jgi:ADP-ribose pyrophosphatase YjhB (NUDIX family)
MPEQNAHCSFCGTKFSPDPGWPRRCGACGSTTYRNPLPVVVVLVPADGGLIAIRRNIEPEKGGLALPGGYLDYGESWQEGARRELQEETGIEIAAEDLRLYDVLTAADGTIVIFGLAEKGAGIGCLESFRSEECQEVTVVDDPRKLCFPLHVQVVGRYFTESRGED